MAYVKEEVNVCKEVKEVFELIEVIAIAVKGKKEVAVIAAECLPKLIIALEGVNAISEEIKDEQIYETVVLSAVKIIKSLKG